MIPIIGAAVGGLARKLGAKAGRWVGRRVAGSQGGRAATAAAGTALTLAGTGLLPTGLGTGIRRNARTIADIDLNPFSGEVEGGFLGFGGRPKRKYRRINYLNQRALKKSIRRVQGFEKIVRSAFSVSRGSLQLKKRRSS